MADLRQIFTYPTNLATDYIDPVWVGDATSGFTRRIDQLLDGTYNPWLNPLAITATTSQVMQNVSKFGNYYESVSAAGHLSRYDFWYQPMVIATKKLIDSESVTADVQNTPMVVTTSNAHEFEDGQRIATSGVDGTWGIDITAGNLPEMYAKVISTTELQVSTTEDLTNIVGYTGGNLAFTLAGGALIGTSSYTMSATTPSVYTNQNVFDYATVDLSSIVGGYNLSITDATPIVFVSSSFTNDTVIPGTYYLMNTPTSGTDHIYMLYPEVGLNQSPGNQSQMRFSGSSSSNMFQFPINPNAAGTDSLGKISATIGETNPGTITTSRALTADELSVFVPQSEIVTWGNGRTFGPNGITNRSTATFPNPIESYAATFELAATGNTNEYTVYYKASQGPYSSAFVDWTVQTATDTSTVAFYSKPQLSATAPWATVNNVRMRWNISSMSDNYVDGTPISFNTTNQMENNPYYLKEVVASSTATYRVYDVYKNAALTNLVGPEEYNVPTSTVTMVSNSGAGNQIILTESNNSTIWDQLSTTVVAAQPYSNWGITQDEELQLVWDPAGSTLTVANKSPASIFLNDVYNGAPNLTETVSYDYSGGSFDGEVRFWVLSTLLDEIAPTGTFVFDMLQANSATNPGTTYTSNLLLTQGETFTVSTQTLTRANGDVWKLVYGGSWKPFSTPPTQLITFAPYGDATVGQVLISGSLLSYEKSGNISTQNYPARNYNGYPTHTYQLATPAPANYLTSGSSTFFLVETSSGIYEAYNDYALTIPTFNFDNTSRPYTGITGLSGDSANGISGADYPSSIDISGTNVTYYSGSIFWKDAQRMKFELNASGVATSTNYYYVKNLPSGYIEFHTTSSLNSAITSAQFITDWAPYIDVAHTGTLGITTQEIVYEGQNATYAPFTTSPFSGRVDYANGEQFNIHTWILQTNTFTENDYPSTTTTAIVPINPSVSTTINLPLTNTTTGQVGPYLDAASMPYEIDTVTLLLPGNQKYLYNTSTPGAQTNTNKYWNAGGTAPLYYSSGATSATFVTTVDTDGYLQSVTLTEEPDAEGRYPDAEDIIVLIEALPDTVVPTPSPAIQADVFDTHDEWVDNAANALKVWPNHVSPASANIVYNQPTIANMSQNGVKYTRSSGFTKWVLEVEYPGMKVEDFQKFHAMAQAMQGQSKSIYFPLRNKDNVNLIWADMMKPGSSQSGSVLPDFVGGNPHYIPAGFTLLKLEGLTASDSEAFREGEVFVANTNQNASFHTAIGAAASNAYGEAMVRMPYPLQTNLNQGEIVDKNPEYAIVTLNSDAFEYSVDVNNYYYVTVTFDLDEWGS